MKKTIIRTYPNFNDFETACNGGDIETTVDDMYSPEVVTVITGNNHGWTDADMLTECKRPQTAINRFFKALETVNPFYAEWHDAIIESVNNGVYAQNDATMANGTESAEPSFYWSIEPVGDGWYIFLNVLDAVHLTPAESDKTETTDETETETTANPLAIVDTVRAELDARNDRSAWDRGVTLYAFDLADGLAEHIGYYGTIPEPGVNLETAILNGADNWTHYSYCGNALVYDYDIAGRLCTPSELKRNRHGDRHPNGRETWIDVQGRALKQAYRRLAAIYRKAYNAKEV